MHDLGSFQMLLKIEFFLFSDFKLCFKNKLYMIYDVLL